MTNTEVRDYISSLTITQLNELVSLLKSDFQYPDTIVFADNWKLTGFHDHTITMTESDFEHLKLGKPINRETWVTDGHTHEVTITYSAGVVSITIVDNHVDNPHTLTSLDGGDVVVEYVATA